MIGQNRARTGSERSNLRATKAARSGSRNRPSGGLSSGFGLGLGWVVSVGVWRFYEFSNDNIFG